VILSHLSKSTRLFVVLIVTSFLLLNLASTYGQFSAAESSSSAYIDQTLLRTTIPSVIVLGKSYTAQVLVVNNSTKVLSGLVVLDLPTYYFYTDQPTQTLQLSPGQSEDFYFRFVAGIPYHGQLNVSAALLLYSGSELLPGESVTLPVYSIVHSPLVGYVEEFVILAVIVAVALLFIIFFLRRRKSRIATSTSVPSQAVSNIISF
jgi:hypothetical protein